MQANPRSLDVLFNSQLRYVVPMFQRLYVWRQTPQWETLWEDVVEKADLQLAGTASNAHYLGALIIEGVRPNSPREVKRFLVIDGQQRLTTLQLIFCAYRDFARQNEWKTLDRATSRYLENADTDVMEHPEEEQFKLWPTTLNRNIFREIIAAGSKKAVETQHPLIRLRRKRRPEPRSNLVEAYLYFATSIETWIAAAGARTNRPPEDCAFALLQALQQDFCVVEIALSEGDDSQEIFYSLNSQGQPLSQSDLLRSLIFMRAEKEKVNRDAIFDEYWSNFETDFWSTEVKRGGRTYSRLDLGLRFFLMAKTGALVDARRVNEEYRRWITAQPAKYANVREELADFTAHAEAYRRYEGAPPSNLASTDLRRVLIDFDVSTALPLVLRLELDSGLSAPEISECLFILESFIARRLFTGEENKEYNKLFVEVVRSIRDVPSSQVKHALVAKLLAGGGTTRHWPTDEQVVEKAISREVAAELRTPALRLILERLEIAHRGKKTEGTEVPAELQIEHVMPQSWAAHWALQGKTIPADIAAAPYLAKDDLANLGDAIRLRNGRVQTLGNLTLLNGYLNPAASNAAFDVKLVEYKHSVLRLNRDFDGRRSWDEEAIRDRGAALGAVVCKIWPRPAAT
jgi:hypothetical protein